jgi:hypothetical protein
LWVLVLSAAAAAAVVYQLGKRSRQVLAGRDAWTTFGATDESTAPPLRPGPRWEEREREEGPTEAPPMVVATMEATPADVRFEQNGALGGAPVPEPAKVGAEAALGSIDLGPAEPMARRRASGVTLAVLGTLAGAGAIALGAWGVASSVSGDDSSSSTTPVALGNVQQVVSVDKKPQSTLIPIQGSRGSIVLVVGAKGYAVLALSDVRQPPAGKTYQAWVIRPNSAPGPAGLFAGGSGVVELTKPVPKGAVVAITTERAGGVGAPTQKPKLIATRS